MSKEQREKEERERVEKERQEREERERQEQQKAQARRGSLTKASPAGTPGTRRAETPVRGPQYEMQNRQVRVLAGWMARSRELIDNYRWPKSTPNSPNLRDRRPLRLNDSTTFPIGNNREQQPETSSLAIVLV